MSDHFDAVKQMRTILFPSLLSTLFSVSCADSVAMPTTDIPIAHEVNKQEPVVDVSYAFATNTGLELELAYQEQLKKQPDGNYLIVVGHDGRGTGLDIGDLEGAVRTLARALLGKVEIINVETGKEKKTGLGLLEYLAQEQSMPWTAVHSFGHGDEMSYWLTADFSHASMTVNHLLDLSQEEKQQIKKNFADGGYWKFYTCHGAADRGVVGEQNISKTITETLGVTTIASNAWVFIEATKNGVYMFPASRSRHKKEFQKKPQFDGTYDTRYSQKEAAWATYSVKKE